MTLSGCDARDAREARDTALPASSMTRGVLVKSLPLLESRSPVSLPTYIQLEPVGERNLRCQMCPIQFRTDGPPHGPPAFMDFELCVRIIDDLPGLRELRLQGLGEPMMHPRFFDMVRYGSRGA